MYSPGEVSRLLSIPPSSLRRYVDKFGHLMSPNARKRRGREFTENDLAIVARIRDLAGQGISLDAITPELEVFEHEPNQPDTPTSALMLINRRFGQYDSRLDSQSDELDHLRRRVDELESLITVEIKKPWYQRLFGKK